MTRYDYLLNYSFTREDEQHAHVYTGGTHIAAVDQKSAEERLRTRHDHLTITDITVYAIYDEHGEHLIYASDKRIR